MSRIKVKILHSRPKLGEVGAVMNYPSDFALKLIESGLAERVTVQEPKKKKDKYNPNEESKKDEFIKE